MPGVRLRGDRVAELRRRAGWSQAELAARLGGSVREQRVGEWERGEQQPRPRYVVKLATALEVDAWDLLTVDPQDPPLLALRLVAGLTLLEVSGASGVPYSTYRRLETGLVQRPLDEPTARSLASALGVPVERLSSAVACSRAGQRASS